MCKNIILRLKKETYTNFIPATAGGITDYVEACDIGNTEKVLLTRENSIFNAFPPRGLLHYSGYGFDERGTPLWLNKKIKSECGNIVNLGIFFHELYAFSTPNRSAFWLSPIQRLVASRLAHSANFWITSREASAKWLLNTAGNKPHAVLPVPSTVGEMIATTKHRQQWIVVFGTEGLRTAIYKTAGMRLISWAKIHGLKIVDIGTEISDPSLSKMLEDSGVLQCGRIDKDCVHSILSQTRFGFLLYPADCLAKSTVFAAFCAHGICPIIVSHSYCESDGLVCNQQYLPFTSALRPPSIKVQEIAQKAFNWYQNHTVQVHVKKTDQLIFL